MAQRNQLFAEVLKSKGINLDMDYFQLSGTELTIVEEVRKSFRYSGKNYLGRSKTRQFYYAAQKAK